MNAYPFSTDVLDRMRRYPNTAVHAPDLIREGISEIERLRALLAEASDEAQLARSTVTDLTIEVEKLRAERDYARKWLCEVLANPKRITGLAKPGKGRPMDFAIEQGWDCFKEDGK